MRSWSWLEAAARFVPPNDRDAVIGDLAEAEASPRQILVEIIGFVARREIALWKHWQPWVASLGIALPISFPLMGTSVWVLMVGQQMQGRTLPGSESLLNLAVTLFLLLAWSWAAGFALVSLSRRTLGASVVACLLPCLFCFAGFRLEALSPFSLFLFVLPAALGVWQCLRHPRIGPGAAVVVAVAVTLLTIIGQSGGSLASQAVLLWPTWYIAATAVRAVTGRENGRIA